MPHKYLRARVTSPSLDITKHSVSSNVLVTVMHFASRVLCSSGVTDSRWHRYPSMGLSGRIERVADDIGSLVEEEALMSDVIRCGWCAFSKVG